MHISYIHKQIHAADKKSPSRYAFIQPQYPLLTVSSEKKENEMRIHAYACISVYTISSLFIGIQICLY